MVSGAAGVLTDSGGIQEETTYLGVPCFTLRANTERPITVELGTNTLLGLEPERIGDVPHLIEEAAGRPSQMPPQWDGNAAERIVDVLCHRSEVRDLKHARRAPRFRGAIEFQDVSFAYKLGTPILSHINLCIPPGQKLAIVGATGAGKSTLVSLVLRFYDPTAGAVLVDGKDIWTFSLQSFREQIGLVLQDSLLLSGTIRDNIAFGRTSATDAEIRAAAAIANADEFIDRLPEKFLHDGEPTFLISGTKRKGLLTAF